MANAWVLDKFDLDLEGSDWRLVFSTSRFLQNTGAVLALRFFAMLLMATYFGLELAQYANHVGIRYYFISFGSWVDVSVLCFLVSSFLVAIRALLSAGVSGLQASAPTPWFVPLIRALYAISLPMSLAAVLLELLPGMGGLGITLFGGADKRELPALLMLASIALGNHSYHILHAIYPMLFALCYLGFTFAYRTSGGLDESGLPFAFAGLEWPNVTMYLNGGTILLGVAGINLLVVSASAYVRSLSDSTAWKRIETTHSMLMLRAPTNP